MFYFYRKCLPQSYPFLMGSMRRDLPANDRAARL
jgi:hypothetical protein